MLWRLPTSNGSPCSEAFSSTQPASGILPPSWRPARQGGARPSLSTNTYREFRVSEVHMRLLVRIILGSSRIIRLDLVYSSSTQCFHGGNKEALDRFHRMRLVKPKFPLSPSLPVQMVRAPRFSKGLCATEWLPLPFGLL